VHVPGIIDVICYQCAGVGFVGFNRRFLLKFIGLSESITKNHRLICLPCSSVDRLPFLANNEGFFIVFYVCGCSAGNFSSDVLQSNHTLEKHFVKVKIKHFFVRFMYASVISGEKLW